MPKKVKNPSKTAEEVTLIRITESCKGEDERICYDPYAIHFISQENLQLLQNPKKAEKVENEKDIIFKGVSNAIVARVRYFDDFVERSANNGLEQLVILGAGYDTRAYRIESIKENVKVFEVDQQGTQSVKIEKIREIFGYLPQHVKYVSIDLEKDIISQKLFDNGYDSSKKTLFIMEGLTMYITPGAVDDILSFIVECSCKGSCVLFDYVSRPSNFNENIDKNVAENLMKFMQDVGESMQFGIEEGTAEQFLMDRGFSNIKNVGYVDYKKAYFTGKNKDRELFSLMAFVSGIN